MTTKPYILGVSAFYHDSAAAIVQGSDIIAAAQEERFSRKKHDPRFPGNAINYCIEEAGIEAEQLSAVVFYENPVLTLDRIFKTLTHTGEEGLANWIDGAPEWLARKLFFERLIRKELNTKVKVLYSEHHQSHLASAFYPSPYNEAAILAIDGVGEWATTSLAVGRNAEIAVLKQIEFPHSLGLLYSAFTQYCGFKVNSGEYKLMGLAPYGEPIYTEKIRENLIDIKEDGSFRLDMDYFGYLSSNQMTTPKFDELFGGTARSPESRISRKDMDLAASIQSVTEEVVLRIARHVQSETDSKHLCLAGGVALNCVANGKILAEGVFEDIWIQPAAGDAGGALGAALLVAHRYFDIPRKTPISGRDLQKGSYLGPQYSSQEVHAYLDANELPYHKVTVQQRAVCVAGALADGKIVGYMVGRSEFGPRALGARSILGDARRRDTQSTMNLKIKYRESFRPFAPSVLSEDCQDYFDLSGSSPYMLIVAPVTEKIRVERTEEKGEDLLEIVNKTRSSIPAVTHVDYSARIQTVESANKHDYYSVISEFKKITGCGVIANTSFNVRGEPIVCSPEDAYRCFMRTEMDVLVIEDYLLYKCEQPIYEESKDWREEYELD